MTEKRISPLTWLQGKFASLVHTHTTSDITDISTSYITKASSDTGFVKSNGNIVAFGTTSGTVAEGNHTHSSYVNPTIADNLTTNDSSKVLSAKQGKVLNDLIGQAISYINQ